MPANLALTLSPTLKATIDAYSTRTGIPRAVIVSRILCQALLNEKAVLPELLPEDRPVGPAYGKAAPPLRRLGMGVNRG